MSDQTGIYIEKDGVLVESQMDVHLVKDNYIKSKGDFYPKVFFERMRKLRDWQNEVGTKISEQFKISSVVDFGCAQGYYLEGFYKNGCSVIGFEYAYDNCKHLIPDEIDNFVFKGDVQEEIRLPNQVDLSFSVEVAEHILPEKSEVFVENLTRASREYIVFSAALPGQKGLGHINEKPFEEWEVLFSPRGFKKDKECTEKVRDIFRNLNVKSRYNRMLSRQIVCFKKES